MSEKRTCRKCKQEKPLEGFHKNRGSILGRVRLCKSCHSSYSKKHRPRWNAYRFGGNRDAALSRDGFKCVTCGMTREQHRKTFKRDITVDHIDGRGRNSTSKNHDIDNLQTLCLICHGRKDLKRRTEESMTVWMVQNKVFTALFETREKAEFFINENGMNTAACYPTLQEVQVF